MAKVGKKSVPIGMAVQVVGTTSVLAPVTMPAPTSALKKEKAKLAREGRSRQGMWDANKAGISYPLWGVATLHRVLHCAS
jgi:hypothetical protein